MSQKNIMDILEERGFIHQTVNRDELYELLGKESVPFYIGFDPTADSLHVGHFLALMAMSYMQKAGHKPVILIGGGTAKIGDPTGRTDMRQMMTNETIEHNVECFRKQMSKFMSFEGDNAAVIVNNADWLDKLNYIEFIRDVGASFSVNQMLTCDAFKARWERGLSFLEFNYMPMQAYDFYHLFKTMGVKLECGGADQWSNMLAGADLIRRKLAKPAYAMTFELLTTSEGKKMGKTQKGAVWLDAAKTSPYDFYQYWRNIADADVEKCLRLITFVPMDRIRELCQYQDERINEAKKVLAYELTKIVHGEEIANEVKAQSESAFGGSNDNLLEKKVPADCKNICDILVFIKACKSKSEARSILTGGAVKIDETAITDFAYNVTDEMLANGFILHKGKKVHVKISKE